MVLAPLARLVLEVQVVVPSGMEISASMESEV